MDASAAEKCGASEKKGWTIMAKKETNKRVCGFCQQSGHNVRSCEKRKAAEAAGGGASVEGAVAVAAAPHSSTALVPVTSAGGTDMATVETGAGAPHLPIEFEGADKQVHVNGTTLRLSYREFAEGITNLTLRFQREATGAKDIQLDIEVAGKLYELLGWALQRQVASRQKAAEAAKAKPNGLKQQEAR